MIAVIVLNGEQLNFDYNLNGKAVIAVDGGNNYLQKYNKKADIIIGDLDSIDIVPKTAIVYPKEKDKTDFELAIDKAIELGYKQLEIICGGGKREDHFLTNLSVMNMAFDCGLTCKMITNYSSITFAEGRAEFDVNLNQTCSLVAFNKAKISRSSGLKYPYNKTELNFTTSLGVSNVATSNKITIEIESGRVLIVLNH